MKTINTIRVFIIILLRKNNLEEINLGITNLNLL